MQLVISSVCAHLMCYTCIFNAQQTAENCTSQLTLFFNKIQNHYCINNSDLDAQQISDADIFVC